MQAYTEINFNAGSKKNLWHKSGVNPFLEKLCVCRCTLYTTHAHTSGNTAN